MKPHRRKKTSPRRDQEGGAPAEPTHEAAPAPDELPAEEVPYEAPEVPYDPGQALAEENQPYVDPNQAYVDPNQAYVDPNQAYVDPNQAYVDPNQAYVDPNQAYVDPNQAYVDPNQAQEEAVPPPPAITPAAGVYDSSPVPAPAPVPGTPAAPVRKPAVGHRVQGRRPVTASGRGRPAYKRPTNYKPSGGGISMMTVFMTLVALGMLGVVAMIVLPKEMGQVKGYPVTPMENAEPRNLLSEAQALMTGMDGKVTFTEAEVNQYLNQRIEGSQGGPLGALVQFKGIYADFSNEQAEFLIEREIFGFPVTMSSKIKAEAFRGSLSFRPNGWTLGKIDLSSRNVKPVIEMFIRMRGAFLDEYQVLQTMANVSFEEDKVTISASRQ
ncbi:hypothetical protein VSU19_15700 [Verrucomicrobiales bacterium BCK34]|nr:hypothetical protein [Verrucomicrobiales bacterium BCK34]